MIGEIDRLYQAGYSIERIRVLCGLSRQKVRENITAPRPTGPKPRNGCIECGKEVFRRRSNPNRKNPSGARCLFHTRLYWADLKRSS